MYKILIVDDEAVIRNGLKVIIDRGNVDHFSIFEAADGREAIKMVQLHEPDIVITDIRMPYVDGFEFIDWVNNHIKIKPVFVILSVHDDFNFAKRAIQYGVKEYLLKPVSREDVLGLLKKIENELNLDTEQRNMQLIKNMQLSESIQILREKYLNLIVKTGVFDEKTVLRQLSGAGVTLEFTLLKVIVVDYRENDLKLRDNFDELDRFALKNIMDEVISDVTKEFYTFYDTEKRMVILLCGYNEMLLTAQIKSISQRSTSCILDYLKVSLYMGVGSSVESIQNIHESYNNALEAIKYKIAGGTDRIIFSKDIKTDNIRLSDQTFFHVKITAEIEVNNKNNIIFLIDEELNKYRNNCNVMELFDFYNKFQTYINSYFVNKGVDLATIFESDEIRFKNFDCFWDIEQLRVYMKRCMLKLCGLVHSLKSMNPDKKIIENIIRFIQDNYNKDINLNIISDHFNKSSSYLSVLFKKETRKNISDYMTMVKIDKAKELLASTNMKIAEIGQNVGFVNAKHFCTVFKKIVNVSPVEYRNKSL